jgi:hypothetical protein
MTREVASYFTDRHLDEVSWRIATRSLWTVQDRIPIESGRFISFFLVISPPLNNYTENGAAIKMDRQLSTPTCHLLMNNIRLK